MSNIDHIEEAKIQKLNEIKAAGIEPYGYRFDAQFMVEQVHEQFELEKEVSVAGRVMAFRAHGKTIFMDVRDSTGKIQLYIGQKVVGEEAFEIMKKMDIGDIVGVKGVLFKTRTEENTIKVKELTLLSKALLPLPEKWHGLKDVQTRYRKRYLDLIVNEDVKNTFKLRSKIVSKTRQILEEDGYLEVETPMMHGIAGGAAGKPFVTHHDTLHTDLFLRIAPELYLKRLLVGGFERVYEINRSFRNEGISVRHNPEFTMLEVYRAFSDCQGMMDLTEKLVRTLAKDIFGTEKIMYQGKEIDLTKWEKVSFAVLMKDKFGIEPQDDTKTWIKKLKAKGVEVEGEELGRTQIINIVGELVEPEEGNHPVFVVDMFKEMCPLAKTQKDAPLLTDRFELYMGGMEIANAYSELNDPLEQRERFMEQGENWDEDFVTALEYGMPPAGGLGIGIDRLVMILTDSANIRDVILFPQLKPEKKTTEEQEAGDTTVSE